MTADQVPDATGTVTPEISVVVPVFEERENLPVLYREVRDALQWTSWELVFVDDGSGDGSQEIVRRIATGDERVRVLEFPENRGQTAAMLCGLRAARGRLVATMDADLQNDPGDIRALYDALGEHDAVAGVRAKRNDSAVRRLSSRIANGVRNWVSGDSVTDTGCSLKLFRREALGELPPMKGMHRFLPTLLRMAGHDVVEHPVGHRPRTRGTSKYGIGNRLVPATVDLFAVCWMKRRRVALDAVETTPARDGAPARRVPAAEPSVEELAPRS